MTLLDAQKSHWKDVTMTKKGIRIRVKKKTENTFKCLISNTSSSRSIDHPILLFEEDFFDSDLKILIVFLKKDL
jgi:hypothetical protein